MATHHERLQVATDKKMTTVDITPRVRAAVSRSKVKDGLCVVAVQHTTVGIFVNENADPAVRHDLMTQLSKLVPRDEEFRHAEGNADAHIKTVLTGNDVVLPVRDGEIVLGQWQGIYLAEYDGPRDREATVTVLGD